MTEKSFEKRAGINLTNRNDFDKELFKKLNLPSEHSPRYMDLQAYQKLDLEKRPRYKTPCQKLRGCALQTTHHDPEDAMAGKHITLNEFLGLDKRGQNKLLSLSKRVSVKCTDPLGQNCGRGNLSQRSGRVELSRE